MDSRIPPIIDAELACAAEMRQHADWMQQITRLAGRYFEHGYTVAWEASVRATIDHAATVEQRAQRIDRDWVQAGEHSTFCRRQPYFAACTPWCRVNEASVSERVLFGETQTIAAFPIARAAPTPPPAPEPPEPKPEEPKKDRFDLIELE